MLELNPETEGEKEEVTVLVMPLPEEVREGEAEVELHRVPGFDGDAVLDMEGEGDAVAVVEPEEVAELVRVKGNDRNRRNITDDNMVAR